MKNYKNYYFFKHLLIAVFLINGYIKFTKLKYSFVNVANSLTIFGLAYLIFGLFRIVMKSGLFNLPAFGFKKVFEVIKTRNYSGKDSELGSYMDYLENNSYEKSYLEFIIIGSLFLILSILIVIYIKF